MNTTRVDPLFRRNFVLAVLVGSLLWTSPGLAHPFHATLTELEFNRDARTIEVAIRMSPNDLETVLSKRMGKRVSLEHHPNIDRLIAEYLRTGFVVKTSSGAKLPMNWVGKEIVSHEIAWVYVEFRVPAKVHVVFLRNWVFFEIAKRQINTVVLKVNGQTDSLTFSPGANEGAKQLRLLTNKPRPRGK